MIVKAILVKIKAEPHIGGQISTINLAVEVEDDDASQLQFEPGLSLTILCIRKTW